MAACWQWACILALGALVVPAEAGDKPVRPAHDAAAIAEPDAPVRAAMADAALVRARLPGSVTLNDVLSRLGEDGGARATAAIGPYLEHDDKQVRIAALGALRTFGLRSKEVVERVRRIVRWERGDELRAAVASLGRIGDARDLPTLLRLLEEEDRALQAASLASLRMLTKAKLPATPVRWRHWTNTVAARQLRALHGSLDALADVSGESASEQDRQTVARFGYHDLVLVERRLAAWLEASEPSLWLRAIHLAGDLRLADLAGPIRIVAGKRRAGPALSAAAEQTLHAFGARIEEAAEQPAEPPPETPTPEAPRPRVVVQSAPLAVAVRTEAPPASEARSRPSLVAGHDDPELTTAAASPVQQAKTVDRPEATLPPEHPAVLARSDPSPPPSPATPVSPEPVREAAPPLAPTPPPPAKPRAVSRLAGAVPVLVKKERTAEPQPAPFPAPAPRSRSHAPARNPQAVPLVAVSPPAASQGPTHRPVPARLEPARATLHPPGPVEPEKPLPPPEVRKRSSLPPTSGG